MTAEDMRELALHGGPKGFDKALVRARSTEAGAVRCRMLSWVARYAPDDEVLTVANEALANAFSAGETFQTVWASAWPLAALVGRGHERQIPRWLPQLLTLADEIAHPVCRMDALYLVWQAVYPAHTPATKPVLEKLVEACLGANSWRAGRTLRDVLVVVARQSEDEAVRFLAAMSDGVYQRQTARRMAEKQAGHLYPFFW